MSEDHDDEGVLYPTHGVLSPEWVLCQLIATASDRMIARGAFTLAMELLQRDPRQCLGSEEVADIFVQGIFIGKYEHPFPEDNPGAVGGITEDEVQRFSEMLDKLTIDEYTEDEQTETDEGENKND